LYLAIKYGPDEPQAYFNRGISKIALKDTTGACNDWKKCSGLGNESANVFLKQYCK